MAERSELHIAVANRHGDSGAVEFQLADGELKDSETERVCWHGMQAGGCAEACVVLCHVRQIEREYARGRNRSVNPSRDIARVV